MASQLSMFGLFEPEPLHWHELPRRKVTARAYGGEKEFSVVDGEADPFEIEVRGIPCTIGYSVGFCTYAIDGPGSLFWSETGFRSFGFATDDPGAIRTMIERYIDTPAKGGSGCGGNLVRWWPTYVIQWKSAVEWSLTYRKKDVWTQWGPERHAEIWANHEAKIAAAEARMWSEGIDPNEVGKPARFKGKWPMFERREMEQPND